MHAGVHYVAAGGNPVFVARGMQLGLETAVAELRRQARTIDGPAEIARVVAGSLFQHRSEEHTSELQSQFQLVCRRLLEKTKPTLGSSPTPQTILVGMEIALISGAMVPP